MNEFEEIIREFVSQSRELIDDVEPRLVELMNASGETMVVDNDTIHTIFRAFHSIKGSACGLKLDYICRVTHSVETLLDLFRSGKASMEASHASILCQTCDFINNALGIVEFHYSDDGLEEPAKVLVRELNQAIEKTKSIVEVPGKGAQPISVISDDMLELFVAEALDLLEGTERLILKMEKDPGRSREVMGHAVPAVHTLKSYCGFMGLDDLQILCHALEGALSTLKEGATPCGEHTFSLLLKTMDAMGNAVSDVHNGGTGAVKDLEGLCVSLKTMQPSDSTRESAPPPPPKKIKAPMREETPVVPLPDKKNARRDIRVDLGKLDLMINLMGELVIAEAMVTQHPDLKVFELENFERSAAHLNRIVRDLQDVAMSLRMVPIFGTFRKMIRLIHDLGVKLGKKVKTELIGEDTEIDKTVMELIADPLVHIIRNAVDHGIEPTAERARLRKEEAGTITLEARHEGGEVWIVIQDDGRGLNPDKILAKGIERGLVKGSAANMTEHEIYQVIFEPGFSTADRVSDISGRGVGMDVVLRNIENLNGKVEVYSSLGQGSMFVLRIPLTLAIIEGMIIRVGKTRYTLPLLAVKESVRVEPGQVTTTPDGQEVVRLREDLVPVIRLHAMHRIVPDAHDLHDGILIILESRDRRVALHVDEIMGQHQTVIKGFSSYMGPVKSVSGCTILGDGDICLILNPAGIINRAEEMEEEEVCAHDGV